ncbi:MAG TPA: AAA family ATPase [Dermatophilaceae bacterium]|nr:AAA family ATPase [Dermatophilaceae bacterium]
MDHLTTAPTADRGPDAPDEALDGPAGPDLLARELAAEQQHVDRVYAELANAARRAGAVAADGMARGRTERTGEARFEELTGLFERDALVFHAARRQHALDSQYEGLVFGRLDLDHPASGSATPVTPASPTPAPATAAGREVRYIGRLGVRDEDYEPLVIDWRAPAAAPFYRATPVEPLDVLRRRVLRCRGPIVVGAEDDLMVADPPDDLVVLGDGALMAALTRSRGDQMRDIVATIQRHQDEAIRAPARGVTEITGGPGTGKTVVALHRAAYLLYADRRRYESGGILVIGPSAAYTAYIERVLPSLGEDSVALRALGDVVDAISTDRHDTPAAAAIKGSLRIREVLARAARDGVPDAPTELRAFVGGYAVRLDTAALERVRGQALRQHQRNLAVPTVTHLLAEAALRACGHPDREDFLERFADHLDVEAFLAAWWPQLDPREALLWLADRPRLERYAAGVFTPTEVEVLHASMGEALRTGTWSIADVALVDELAARLGPVQEAPAEERGFFEIDELDALATDLPMLGSLGGPIRPDRLEPAYEVTPEDARDRLLHGRIGRPDDYAHILVDEAQDLSPMQWRMLGRRGRAASWTVVGDAAQSSWPDPVESVAARGEAWGVQQHRGFHMTTNYRNAREIFDYAAAAIRRHVPDADIPDAVRETGVLPVDGRLGDDPTGAVVSAVDALLDEVDGSIGVITPSRYAAALAIALDGRERVRLVDPLSSKGLEWDATVVVDPDEIVAQTAGGVRALYVALTRAAHRMTVLHAG